MDQHLQEIDEFIALWPASSGACRDQFVRLKEHLRGCADTTIQFVARPGVTYSLRAAHASQHDRPLFTMIDVIDDQPRWLSVCFYAEMVRDPEEQGDYVPGGLLGEDAICFDIETGDELRFAYVLGRIDEAYRVAASA